MAFYPLQEGLAGDTFCYKIAQQMVGFWAHHCKKPNILFLVTKATTVILRLPCMPG